MARSMQPRLPGEMKEDHKEERPEKGIIFKMAKSPNLLAGLAFFFIILLFFYDLFQDRFLFTERDLAPYFIPPRFFWVESIKNGDFPLWNPYQFNGHPFFANPQHAILYPLHLLFFFLPFDLAFNFIIILHFFLGGFFTYLFLRELQAGYSSALISGLIFMLSGYLLSIHSLLNSLLSVVWTPLIILFFRRALISPGLKNEIITALLMTISFLGGGVEIVYGNFLILFLMLFFPPWPLSENLQEKWRNKILRRGKIFIFTSLFFGLLSAVQLLPFFELFLHSIRGAGISFAEATIWSFAPRDFLLFFLPDAYGYFLDMQKYWTSQCWLKTLYTGGLPFLLSIFFFLFGKERLFYGVLIFFSFFLSLGHYNPLYPLIFNYLPFFAGIRYPVKFLYIFILVLAITAGLGWESLQAYARTGKDKKINFFLTVAALILGFILLLGVLGQKEIAQFLKGKGFDYPNFNHLLINLSNTKRLLFYLIIFLLLLRFGQEWLWPRWAKTGLVLLLAADLFGNMGFFGKERTADFFQKTRLLEIISADKGFHRTFTTPRTASLDSPLLIPEPTPLNLLKEKYLPSLFLLFKIPNIWGIEVLPLKKGDELYKTFTSSPSLTGTNLIYLYGIKYVISTLPIQDKNYELLYAHLEGLAGEEEELLQKDTVKLYRLRNYLPRAWLVHKYKILTAQDILPFLTNKDFHPAEMVILEEEPKWAGKPVDKLRTTAQRFSEKVTFIHEENNKLVLRVSCAENALLVLSDTYFPGWKAQIIPLLADGSPGKETQLSKILRANYNFRALPLQAGDYEICFSYEPFNFKLGLLLTVFSLLLILVYFFYIRLKRSAARGQQPDLLPLR